MASFPKGSVMPKRPEGLGQQVKQRASETAPLPHASLITSKLPTGSMVPSPSGQLGPASRPSGPGASMRPSGPSGGPGASMRPPGPGASMRPTAPVGTPGGPPRPPHGPALGPGASMRPPGPGASMRPPGPGASMRPPGPGASMRPPGPGASMRPPGPGASMRPPGPGASMRPPGPGASMRPPGPGASMRPPLTPGTQEPTARFSASPLGPGALMRPSGTPGAAGSPKRLSETVAGPAASMRPGQPLGHSTSMRPGQAPGVGVPARPAPPGGPGASMRPPPPNVGVATRPPPGSGVGRPFMGGNPAASIRGEPPRGGPSMLRPGLSLAVPMPLEPVPEGDESGTTGSPTQRGLPRMSSMSRPPMRPLVSGANSFAAGGPGVGVPPSPVRQMSGRPPSVMHRPPPPPFPPGAMRPRPSSSRMGSFQQGPMGSRLGAPPSVSPYRLGAKRPGPFGLGHSPGSSAPLASPFARQWGPTATEEHQAYISKRGATMQHPINSDLHYEGPRRKSDVSVNSVLSSRSARSKDPPSSRRMSARTHHPARKVPDISFFRQGSSGDTSSSGSEDNDLDLLGPHDGSPPKTARAAFTGAAAGRSGRGKIVGGIPSRKVSHVTPGSARTTDGAKQKHPDESQATLNLMEDLVKKYNNQKETQNTTSRDSSSAVRPVIKTVAASTAALLDVDRQGTPRTQPTGKKTQSQAVQTPIFSNTLRVAENIVRMCEGAELPTEIPYYDAYCQRASPPLMPLTTACPNTTCRAPVNRGRFALQVGHRRRKALEENGLYRHPTYLGQYFYPRSLADSANPSSPTHLLGWTSRTPGIYVNGGASRDKWLLESPKGYIV